VLLALAPAGALAMFGPSAGAGGSKLVADNDKVDCPKADSPVFRRRLRPRRLATRSRCAPASTTSGSRSPRTTSV
jgi:hypothetical protein